MTDYSNWVLKGKHEKLLFGPYQGRSVVLPYFKTYHEVPMNTEELLALATWSR